MLKERMSKEQFLKYIELMKNKDKFVSDIYNVSKGMLDIVNLDSEICKPLYFLEKVLFTETELDYIGWFLYEYRENGMKIYDNDNKVIADLVDAESVWEYLNRE